MFTTSYREKKKRKRDSAAATMSADNANQKRKRNDSQTDASKSLVSTTFRRKTNKPPTQDQTIQKEFSHRRQATTNDAKTTTTITPATSPIISETADANHAPDLNKVDQIQHPSRKSKRTTSTFSSSLRRFLQVTIGRSSNIIANGTSSNNINATNNNSININNCDLSIHNSIPDSPVSQTSLDTNQSSCDKTGTLDADNSELSSTNSEKCLKRYEECPLCVVQFPKLEMTYGASCTHRVCKDCMKKYITNEISHSRLSISCPVCPLQIHPNKIKAILNDEVLYLKYENFMLRRVIAAEPDARWCPAPDCGYVVIASGCASCPEIHCGREGCNTTFCYHCKQEWHPDETCSAASIKRGRNNPFTFNIGDLIEETGSVGTHTHKTVKIGQQSTLTSDDIKECPVCGSRIIKMNDGSCNHMTCSICETEFCWLCMKEINDLHYFSPSGCTFWGKKPWSRKKKILWQLGMLVGAPVCIILIAGVAIPAIVIGIPVWAGRKLRNRLEREPLSKYRKNAIVTGGVLVSLIVSPLISAVALAVGVPILLGYVYGVVPISLCRSGGCGLSSAESFDNLQQATFKAVNKGQYYNRESRDTGKKYTNPSVGDISLETNSTNDDGHSTRALAGSIYKESGYTLAEIHNK